LPARPANEESYDCDFRKFPDGTGVTPEEILKSGKQVRLKRHRAETEGAVREPGGAEEREPFRDREYRGHYLATTVS
jgi:hypothetical protein